MGDDKTFSIETVACLMATLMKKSPNGSLSLNYGEMSAMSSLTNAPLTKSVIDHQFRHVKKRANELLAKAKEIEDGGEKVEEVKGQPKASPKRGASAATGDSGSNSAGATKKKRVVKGGKVKQESVDGDEEEVVG